MRGLIVGAIREALAGCRHPPGIDRRGRDARRVPRRSDRHTVILARPACIAVSIRDFVGRGRRLRDRPSFQRPLEGGFAEAAQAAFDAAAARARMREPAAEVLGRRQAFRSARRARRCTKTTSSPRPSDSLVIVDQHAAHERLVYEALKNALDVAADAGADAASARNRRPAGRGCRTACRCTPRRCARFGLGIERFGPGAVAVRETPAMLGEADVEQLVRDLADEIADTTRSIR